MAITTNQQPLLHVAIQPVIHYRPHGKYNQKDRVASYPKPTAGYALTINVQQSTTANHPQQHFQNYELGWLLHSSDDRLHL